MPLADFLGMNGDEWRDTLGLVIVFFLFFPLLLHGLIGVAVAQVLGERRENQRYANGEHDLDPHHRV
jgi:hypothetical protein